MAPGRCWGAFALGARRRRAAVAAAAVWMRVVPNREGVCGAWHRRTAQARTRRCLLARALAFTPRDRPLRDDGELHVCVVIFLVIFPTCLAPDGRWQTAGDSPGNERPLS